MIDCDPLDRVGGSIILVDSWRFEVLQPDDLLQVAREWLDSSHALASSLRTTSGGLVVVGAMQIIVPLTAALVFIAVPILAVVLNQPRASLV
jgi:hypothetical protein